ncbi:PRC-barrel domain-containing protein [Deinococcus peraridilitoris]|uniref:PRC-barrel protein n=1 Tax=Deinococcus peraridilitoris (strain DSM 19664 / LMG 22246 / CIP 109416 / KR-200) TaxID=937777 RepID=L0A6T7_DEIPD|nr:PRC-barrel domain-containing protein [Deinococcus peraridilitoris]AFZ69551.1 PRC-barrel protein [Deinococcus peraridilitoris DSM 19664]
MHSSRSGIPQRQTARHPEQPSAPPAGLKTLSGCNVKDAAPLLGWLFRRVYDRHGCIIGGVTEVLIDASLDARWLEVSEQLAVNLGQRRFLIPVEWVADQHEDQVFLHVGHHDLTARQTPEDAAFVHSPNNSLSGS